MSISIIVYCFLIAVCLVTGREKLIANGWVDNPDKFRSCKSEWLFCTSLIIAFIPILRIIVLVALLFGVYSERR